MPLGIVSDEEFDQIIHPPLIKQQELGRGPVKEMPSALRNIIAEEKLNGASSKELVKTFGISPSSVSAYANGATSTASYNEPDPKLNNHVRKVQIKIRNNAEDKLLKALKNITDDKLENASAKVLSAVAKDMASVVRDMEPPKESNDKGGTTIVFVAPPIRDENTFDLVEVKDA